MVGVGRKVRSRLWPPGGATRLRGERTLKGMRNTLKTSSSGAIQRVEWDGRTHACRGSDTSTGISFPSVSVKTMGPDDTFSSLPLFLSCLIPLPSLVLRHFQPFAQSLAYNSILVLILTSGHLAFGWKGQGGFVVTGCLFLWLYLYFWLLRNWVGRHAVWKFSHFSVTRLWIFPSGFSIIIVNCGSLFWNKNSECTYIIKGLVFVLSCFCPSCNNKNQL